MATLRNLSSARVRVAPARLLIGRASACGLRLEDRHVSGEHATLIWTGRGWELRDLGSSNGTFLDGRRLSPGESVAISAGMQLCFGHERDPWEIVEAGPPAALAERMGTDEVRTATDGILALPDSSAPEVLVFTDRLGRWVVEIGDAPARPVADQEVFQVGGHSWRISVPDRQEGTAAIDRGPSIDTITLRFAVSRDEEHVQLTVVHRGQETALEPREHGYTLLTLARSRIEEAQLPESEQGWIERDQLLKMLGLDSNALNVAIYRARGQLAAAGVEGAAGIVEVRRGQRRIGLAPDRLEVVPL